jgi:hypothetical protein
MDELFNGILKNGFEHGLPYLAIAVFSVASSLLAVWMKSRVDAAKIRRDADRDDFQTIIAERKSRSEEQNVEIRDLKSQINLMQSRISALEGRVAQRPFPEWSLSFNGIYTWCNTAMVAKFLRGRSADWLIGKSHGDIWPPQVISILQRLDAEVREASVHMAVVAGVTVSDADPPWIIIKYGQADPTTGAVINFYGMAVPMSERIGSPPPFPQLIADGT